MAQRYPRLAFGGANYLVVWQDYRSGNYQIYGARVSRSGQVLDPDGIAISVAANTQRYPSVAFDGTNYFVVWQDKRNGDYDIYAARVSQSGAVLDTGIGIARAALDQSYPSVAFDGSNYLVAWEDNRTGLSQVRAARVTQVGQVLDTAGIVLSSPDFAQSTPAVAFDGINYIAVWEDWRGAQAPDVYATRISTTGQVLDSAGIALCVAPGYQQNPAIAFDGSCCDVTWEDGRSGGGSLYAARLDLSGMLIDTFPVTDQPGAQNSPALATGGNGNVLTVWSGWASRINGHPANALRIWGSVTPFTQIGEGTPAVAPQADCLAFPNPFQDRVTIRLPRTAGSVSVFDAAGRLVRTLASSQSAVRDAPPGGILVWDGTDDAGRELPAGVYFLGSRRPGTGVSGDMTRLLQSGTVPPVQLRPSSQSGKDEGRSPCPGTSATVRVVKLE